MLVVGARDDRPGAGLLCQCFDRCHVEMPGLGRRHHLHDAAAGELLGDPIGREVTERRKRRIAREVLEPGDDDPPGIDDPPGREEREPCDDQHDARGGREECRFDTYPRDQSALPERPGHGALQTGDKVVHAREAIRRLRGKRPGHGFLDQSGGARAGALGAQAGLERRPSRCGPFRDIQQRRLADEHLVQHAR